MKKILVLSYYFFPANSVVSPRIQSWADEFLKHGLFPVVITRHFTGNEKVWADFLTENNSPVKHISKPTHQVYYLPNKVSKSFFEKLLTSNKLTGKLFYIINSLLGNYTTEANARNRFKLFAEALLQKEKFDAILVSSPPINITRLGYELANKFSLPLIVDCRDIWNNYITNQQLLKPSWQEKIYLFILERYVARWMSKAKLVTSVSQPLVDEIKKITKTPAEVVTNGYEEKFFSVLRNKPTSKDKFECSVIGTVYPMQDISVCLDGIKMFCKKNNATLLQFNFIGIESIKEVAENIRHQLSGLPVTITNKIERNEALDIMAKSHVLLYMGWKGFKGIYSAKIFEYLGIHRNIIIAPGDDDVLDELVTSCNAGKIANSAQEFYNHISEYYLEWSKTGNVSYAGIETEIKKYSRERQAEIFAKHILKAIE